MVYRHTKGADPTGTLRGERGAAGVRSPTAPCPGGSWRGEFVQAGSFGSPPGWQPQQLTERPTEAAPTHFGGGGVGVRSALVQESRRQLRREPSAAGTGLPSELYRHLKLGALIPFESRTGNNASQREAKRSICSARWEGGGGTRRLPGRAAGTEGTRGTKPGPSQPRSEAGRVGSEGGQQQRAQGADAFLPCISSHLCPLPCSLRYP